MPIQSKLLRKRSRVDSRLTSVNGDSILRLISTGPDIRKAHHQLTLDPRRVRRVLRRITYDTLTIFKFSGADNTPYYIYIEASAPQKTGDRAGLISPFITRPKQGACFQFYYHM